MTMRGLICTVLASQSSDTRAQRTLLLDYLRIINPNYNLQPVQTCPELASRELQFHPFSITREAPTTEMK